MYADDLIQMSETLKGLRNNFIKLKKAFESKGLKVYRGKTKVIVIGCITKDGLSNSTIDQCQVNSLRIKAVLHVPCGRWIHRRCSEVKRVTASLFKTLHAGRNVKDLYWRGSRAGRKAM